jgi:flagellin
MNMTVINTNVKALVSQNAITTNNRSMSAAMEQLSTGKRINSAKDDAAGLAIASKMTSQIRGLDQAVRNANDGISLLQTAEGATIEITNMLQRMRELSVQSANDTNTAEERSFLDLEFQQLKGEIDRVVNNTQWSGVNILDGSFNNNGEANGGKFVFQVGANANQTISHTINVFGLGNVDGAVGTTAVADASIVAATTQTAQVQTLTLAGTYAAGDVITVNLNENMFRYTVVEGATTSDQVAEGLQAALSAKFSDDFTIAQPTASAGVIDIRQASVADTTAGNTFTLSASATDGEWDDIASLEIGTQANSNSAITTLDVALTSVNKARAELGAVINRLNYAVDNLSNVSMNTSASRSRILDADYAKASSELARTQIIQQAATAMLAQANQQPQAVLQLLQG